VSLKIEDYESRFVALLEAEHITFSDPNDHVKRAITLGLADFWGAHPWSFKQYEYSLTCSGEETDDLPDGFESFRMAREEETNMGRRLSFKTKEEFDSLVPKLSWHSVDTPQIYTAYMDAETGKWKVRFWPQPAGGETIYMSLYLDAPDDVARVPDRFHAALDACIAKFVYPMGNAGYTNARIVAEAEIKQARHRDKLNQSKMTVMPTDTQNQVSTGRIWL